MSVVTRRYLPIALALVTALLMFADHYFSVPIISDIADELSFDGTMLTAILVTVGSIGLVLKNSRDIMRQRQGRWYYSIWLLIVFFAMVIVGIGYTQASSGYRWLYDSFASPILSTQYGLCGFYIILAVYRTFRVRSVESGIFVATALLQLWNQMPIGEFLIPISKPIATWMNAYLNVSVNRGFMVLGAIGSVMLGIRVLMGYEKAVVPEA